MTMRGGARRAAWGWVGGAVVVWLTLVTSACAPTSLPPATPGAPRYPDYVYPALADAAVDSRVRARYEAAWSYLQMGDTRTAGREFDDLLRRQASLYPADAALGYVSLSENKPKDALARFERLSQRYPRYTPALAGRGEALLALGQIDGAIAAFEAARTASPGLAELGRRIEALRFSRLNELVASATRAAAAGRFDEARNAYERALAASPESAFLYRDLGLVELRAGLTDVAQEHLRRALDADQDDVRAWVGLASAAEASGDLLGAAAAWERAVALEPSDAHRRALERIRSRNEAARLPAEYRAIAANPQLSRGDLAALLGIRVVPLLPVGRRPQGVVLTDARSHWAATWILAVTRAGLMDPFANHTFQPRGLVRRGELAVVVSRALALLPPPTGGKTASRQPMADVTPDHAQYLAVAAAVAAGVMPTEGGAFRPGRAVTGAEAIEVMERLESAIKRGRSGKGSGR